MTESQIMMGSNEVEEMNILMEISFSDAMIFHKEMSTHFESFVLGFF